MNKIIFDTDVLIELLRGTDAVQSHIHTLLARECTLAYTPVTEAEIYKGIRSNERAKTAVALGSIECLVITREIGKLAGEFMRTYSKSHGLELPDALIAAAAKVHRFALCTFNWKHYPMTDIQHYTITR